MAQAPSRLWPQTRTTLPVTPAEPGLANHAIVSATSTGSPPWREAVHPPAGLARRERHRRRHLRLDEPRRDRVDRDARAWRAPAPIACTSPITPGLRRRVVRLPGVAGDPADRRDAHDPPVVAHRLACSSSRVDSLRSEQVDPERPCPSGPRSCCPSVLSRVTPALWTTTSTPPCASSRCDAMIDGRVLVGDVDGQRRAADLLAHAFEIALARRGCRGRRRAHRRARAPWRSTSPMPRAAPVTSADLAVERTLPVDRRVEAAAPGPIRTTCPDTYADFGESKNRSVDSIWSSAPGSTYTSCAVEPRRDLLADRRASAPRARAARSPRVGRSQLLGRGAEHDHAPAGAQLADHRVEERVRLAELLVDVDPCRVEDERLERLVGRPRSIAAPTTSAPSVVSTARRRLCGRRAARAPPSSTGPVTTALAGLVALELDRASGRPICLETILPTGVLTSCW